MKKILALMLVLSMAFCFAACSSNKETDKTDSADASSTTEDVKYSVGICQLVQHEALDAATKGFKEALVEKLGDKVEFDEQNASGETANCTTIVSKFVSDKVDLIMANATPALTAAAQATNEIPIVATSITDFSTALDIDDWTGVTDCNVTGTADLAPLKEQANMVKELCPDAKTVGLLFCSAEANSKYQIDIVAKELADLGYTTKEFSFVDTNDVTAVTQQAAEECDVIYAPTDNTVASNGEAINNVLEPANIPLIAGEEGICKACGVATLSISYYDIGYKAGEMAYEILVNGADPATTEIAYSDTTTKKYMADRADALKIEIPETYEAIVVE